MPIPCPPPIQQVVHATPELSLLPGSDPVLLNAFQWTLDHSPSLQQLVQELGDADQAARYRFVQGLSNRYTSNIHPTERQYDIDIEVPILAWRQCGDALEPWIASTLFLVLQIVKNEKYRTLGTEDQLAFLKGSISASFIFQRKIKEELVKADPERLKDLPDGASIYASHFEPTRWGSRKQRWLPGGPPSSSAPTASEKIQATTVAVVDRPISVPPLPRTGEEGRRQFKEVHLKITQAMDDLNRALMTLYARPKAGSPLANEGSVSSERAAEARELVQVIAGTEFRKLERVYLDTWKGWQAALVEGGFAHPVQTGAILPAQPSPEYQEAKRKAKQILAERSRRFGLGHRLDPLINKQEIKNETNRTGLRPVDAGYLDDLEETAGGGKAPDIDFLQSNEISGFAKNEDDVFKSQALQAVAHQILPTLSDAWDPLVNHLNEVARRVLDQGQTPTSEKDATVSALRVQARLAVLERFRKALWYCDLVWSQIAATEALPPPPRLAPPLPLSGPALGSGSQSTGDNSIP